MLTVILYIIGTMFTLTFVIGTHEFAHFITARWCKIKVLRFSIGFGAILWSRHDKHGTEFVIAKIPLGGYVKMLDTREDKVPEHEKTFAFNTQPLYKKIIVIAAGPLCNFLCAIILYWLLFWIGFTTLKPVIGAVTPQSIAAQAKLTPGSTILSINEQTTRTWPHILVRLLSYIGTDETIVLTTQKPNQPSTKHRLNLSTWKITGTNPDIFSSLGFIPYIPPLPNIIGKIAIDSPIKNKLHIGDKILKINQTTINDWQQLSAIIQANPDVPANITIERNGVIQNLTINIGMRSQWFIGTIGYLGISPAVKIPPALIQQIKYPPLLALYHASNQVYELVMFNFILTGKIITGKLTLNTLSGPLTIVESAGNAFITGWLAFLSFLAFLSIAIGAINLLPIPGLDGGHLFLYVIETIIQRPIPEKILRIIYSFGFILILFLIFTAVFNDVSRLLT